MKVTRKYCEEKLNDLGLPETYRKSNRGPCPDGCKFGSWLRRNDPIAFEVFFQEEQRNEEDRKEFNSRRKR